MTAAFRTILIVIGFSFADRVAAEEFPILSTPYSAEATVVTSDVETSLRMWVDGPKRRHEMAGETGVTITLVRADTGDVFVFEDGNDQAMRMAYEPAMAGTSAPEVIESLNPVFEARETIAGEDTLRFSYRGTGPLGNKQQGMIWVTPDGIIVREQASAEFGGSVVDVRTEVGNIIRGAQPAALFELPDGIVVE